MTTPLRPHIEDSLYNYIRSHPNTLNQDWTDVAVDMLAGILPELESRIEEMKRECYPSEYRLTPEEIAASRFDDQWAEAHTS